MGEKEKMLRRRKELSELIGLKTVAWEVCKKLRHQLLVVDLEIFHIENPLEEDALPHIAFLSEALFIVGGPGGLIVSEHKTSKDAEEALAFSNFATKRANDAVYCRTLHGWKAF